MTTVPAWMTQAACRGRSERPWYPERGESNRVAVRVCEGCPVKQACLEYALVTQEPYGIWGGVTEVSRRRMLRKLYGPRSRGANPVPEHGTSARYRRHLRADEQPCNACLRAERVRVSARAAARRVA